MEDIATSAPSLAAHGPVTLSIIIPAYDEVDRIGSTVRRILSFLDSRPYRAEVIVVLDGGRPGASEAIAGAAGGDARVRVLDNGTNRGKGYSVRRGMRESVGEYALFADADLSLPIEDADRFLAPLADRAELTIGSRAIAGAREVGEQQPLRQSLSRLFNWIVRLVVVSDLRDTQCGFKAFKGDVARTIFSAARIDGFGFDVEVLRIASRRGYRILELPVTCEYHAASSVRKVRHGLMMLNDVARILSHDWRGRYQ
jgi:glycosyltransferase involved in cell wall biosynthesis